MREYLVESSLDLMRNSVLRIEAGRGIVVYVREGAMWVMEDGERVDRVLQAGQWHQLGRRGTALCCALKDGVVTLTAPKPAGFARRIVLKRPGTVGVTELYNAARERRAFVRARLKRLWAGLTRLPALGTSEI